MAPAAERRCTRRKLGVPALLPWDFEVDPNGHPPLRPFKTTAELVDGCRRIFDRIDPGIEAQFRAMAADRRLDLDSRKGKALDASQGRSRNRADPFIFMNAVGTDSDLETMLHEAGHAFHAYASRNDPLLWYRNPPLEFCEVASMGIEGAGRPVPRRVLSAGRTAAGGAGSLGRHHPVPAADGGHRRFPALGVHQPGTIAREQRRRPGPTCAAALGTADG